jgi:hypothetical protein
VPTRARANFAGNDTLVCTLEDALLPAERMMVQMVTSSACARREARGAMQAAPAEKFVRVVEEAVQREVPAVTDGGERVSARDCARRLEGPRP